MKINPQDRIVTLGVRELSEFEICRRLAGRHAGRWRTEIGRTWHQAIQKEYAAEFAAERSLSGQIQCRDWTLQLEGRCDLYSKEDSEPPVFGEIKTVTDPLPLPAFELRNRFPSYFRQLAIYLRLAGQQWAPSTSFLLFLNIDSGIRQKVFCEEADFLNLENHLDAFADFLAFTATRADAQEKISWKSFRSAPRPGQVEASNLLSQAEGTHKILGFQAPTGFGKTRIVLEHSLQAIREGKADRVLYLTGKTSGQEQICAEIRAIFPERDDIRAYRMRNHREHWATCPLDGCHPEQCAPPPEESQSLPVAELIRHPGYAEEAWEGIRETAEAYQQCPYSLSRGMLPFSDVWIGDYNYLFSPSSRHVYYEQPSFDPSRTWLLIDEAHNLTDRVTNALSGSLDQRTLLNAAQDVREANRTSSLASVLREISREVGNLPTGKAVPADAFYTFSDLFENAVQQLTNTSLPWRELPGETVATLQMFESALMLIESEELEPLLWSPMAGRLEWLPLNPGPWIASTITEFAQTVLFSATLEPFDRLTTNFGLSPPETQLVRIESTIDQPFQTVIDARVQTTLRERKRSIGKTAEAIQQLADTGDSCIAAFFPSFEYAEAAQVYLETLAPHLRCTLQPRNLDAAEREQFARHAPLSNDILLLMLGGSFAEAIDSFGGVVETAIIIGPALPELSDLNRIRIDRYPSREEGFHEICRIPGMRRVNQAIGRLVRSHEHRAKVILHDRRFAEPAYRELLRADLGEIETIRNDPQWVHWLSSIK